MVKFICFGSGSSGNCYYLNADNYGIVIDMGIGTRTFKKYVRDYGISFGEINALLVTHDHTDHVKSVGAFSGEFHLPVFATQAVHQGMQRNNFMYKKILDDNKKYITEGIPFETGPFRITPFSVPHDSSANCGYFIEYRSEITFCIITDAGCFTDEMRQFIPQTDYLVVEANYDDAMLESGSYPLYLKRRIRSNRGHMDTAETARVLAENLTNRTKGIWLCHLSEENNHPELARKTVETTLTDAGFPIGTKLFVEVLKRKVPSAFYELE